MKDEEEYRIIEETEEKPEQPQGHMDIVIAIPKTAMRFPGRKPKARKPDFKGFFRLFDDE